MKKLIVKLKNYYNYLSDYDDIPAQKCFPYNNNNNNSNNTESGDYYDKTTKRDLLKTLIKNFLKPQNVKHLK